MRPARSKLTGLAIKTWERDLQELSNEAKIRGQKFVVRSDLFVAPVVNHVHDQILTDAGFAAVFQSAVDQTLPLLLAQAVAKGLGRELIHGFPLRLGLGLKLGE